MSKKKTQEEYVSELAIKNQNVEVIGEYNGARTPILHHCLVHDVYWNMSPTNALKGCGCKQCGIDKYSSLQRKTSDQYKEELRIKNPNLIVLGEYINSNTPILHNCIKHNITWCISPSSALRGSGCIECWKEKLHNYKVKDHEKYVKEVSIINPNIEVIGNYIGADINILHKCRIDDYEWMARPANILHGYGCPKCAGNMMKTQEEYIEDVYKINKDIEVVGKYSGVYSPILHKCKIDGYEWYSCPVSILHGSGCPKCGETRGEKKIGNCLDNNYISYVREKSFDDCRDIRPLPFDFYIPDYNICIEYQGEQHYEPVDYFGGEEKFKIQQLHDNIKKEYCEKNGIHLLCISYLDFDNIEKLVLYYLRMY